MCLSIVVPCLVHPPFELLPPMPQKQDDPDKTRWRPDKRGMKASKFPFTIEQEQILYRYGLELESNISSIAKGRPLKNNTHVTAWKKSKAADILDQPEFKTLDFITHTPNEWLNVSRS